VLSGVRTAVHGYEHVSFHYTIIQTVLPFIKSVENTLKHSFFVTFNIDFFPSFFPLFWKISVKGWVAQLKVKTAKKIRKFSSIESSTLRNRILNSFRSFTRIC